MFILKNAPTMEGVRGAVATRVLYAYAISATQIGQALLVTTIVFRLMTGAALADQALLLAELAAVIAVRVFLVRLSEIHAAQATKEIRARLRERLLERIAARGPAWAQGRPAGAMQSVLTDKVDALAAYLTQYLPQVAVTALVSPAIIIAVAFIAPSLALLLVAAIAFALFSRPIWDRVVGDRRREYWARQQAMAARFVNALQGMPVLRAFGAQERFGQTLARDAAVLCEATIAQVKVTLLYTGFGTLAVAVGTAGVIGYGAVLFAGGHISAFEVILLLFLSMEALRPVAQLSKAFHAGYSGILAGEAIATFLADEMAEGRRLGAVPRPASASLGADIAISVENVTYRYPKSALPALEKVTVRFPQGMTTAIVGPSGAGKSTLLSILLSQLEPEEGHVLLGREASLALSEGRRSISFVPQDTYLFTGTIADNLRLACPDATAAMMMDALAAVRMQSWTAGLPQGLDAPIGERGLDLSGGQRQRLAIARALLADAPIVLLDEPTSAIDLENEAALRAGLRRLARGRTVIVVAHRATTIAAADHLVLLDSGRLVASGRPRDVLATPLAERLFRSEEMAA